MVPCRLCTSCFYLWVRMSFVQLIQRSLYFWCPPSVLAPTLLPPLSQFPDLWGGEIDGDITVTAVCFKVCLSICIMSVPVSCWILPQSHLSYTSTHLLWSSYHPSHPTPYPVYPWYLFYFPIPRRSLYSPSLFLYTSLPWVHIL